MSGKRIVNRISNHVSLVMTIQILRYHLQNTILNEGFDVDENLFYNLRGTIS